jgi:hypothetical protein
MVASMSSVRVAKAATASRAIAVSTAPAGESPQQNGLRPLTRTAADPRPSALRSQCLDDDPSVSASYSPVISAERSAG